LLSPLFEVAQMLSNLLKLDIDSSYVPGEYFSIGMIFDPLLLDLGESIVGCTGYSRSF
jgi:hypothetical protein